VFFQPFKHREARGSQAGFVKLPQDIWLSFNYLSPWNLCSRLKPCVSLNRNAELLQAQGEFSVGPGQSWWQMTPSMDVLSIIQGVKVLRFVYMLWSREQGCACVSMGLDKNRSSTTYLKCRSVYSYSPPSCSKRSRL